jgi:hypothetical protein
MVNMEHLGEGGRRKKAWKKGGTKTGTEKERKREGQRRKEGRGLLRARSRVSSSVDRWGLKYIHSKKPVRDAAVANELNMCTGMRCHFALSPMFQFGLYSRLSASMNLASSLTKVQSRQIDSAAPKEVVLVTNSGSRKTQRVMVTIHDARRCLLWACFLR